MISWCLKLKKSKNNFFKKCASITIFLHYVNYCAKNNILYLRKQQYEHLSIYNKLHILEYQISFYDEATKYIKRMKRKEFLFWNMYTNINIWYYVQLYKCKIIIFRWTSYLNVFLKSFIYIYFLEVPKYFFLFFSLRNVVSLKRTYKKKVGRKKYYHDSNNLIFTKKNLWNNKKQK